MKSHGKSQRHNYETNHDSSHGSKEKGKVVKSEYGRSDHRRSSERHDSPIKKKKKIIEVPHVSPRKGDQSYQVRLILTTGPIGNGPLTTADLLLHLICLSRNSMRGLIDLLAL